MRKMKVPCWELRIRKMTSSTSLPQVKKPSTQGHPRMKNWMAVLSITLIMTFLSARVFFFCRILLFRLFSVKVT